VAFISGGTIADAAMKVTLNVLQDPAADPDVLAAIRRYYDPGQLRPS
jgi:hypothetical protein